MGVFISLPVTIASTFISSFLGSCCSSAIKGIFNSVDASSSSFAARLIYAIGLFLNVCLSWIAASFSHSSLWPNRLCTNTGECGFFVVHKLSFALGLFHLLLAVLLINIKSTKHVRSQFQNKWWWTKSFIYLCLIVTAYYIPNGFFVVFSKWVSVPSGALFIIIGLILLVDFAHEWAETCIRHMEMENESSVYWKRFLIIGTCLMYFLALVMDVVMVCIFCGEGCNVNINATMVNILFTILITIVSVHPRVQQYNPNCGIAQSSIVAVYCSYLNLSAMASKPDDIRCNPLVGSSSTRKMSVILGSIFTFIAIAYTTTRAAANSAFRLEPHSKFDLGDDNAMLYQGIGGSRSQLREEAIRQAVFEGSLPESVLYNSQFLQDYGEGDEVILFDDEKHMTKYNYSLFHFIFFLATQWIALLLTINVTKNDVGDFIPVGRTHFYSWIKIISAWVCYVLYGWTTLAPMVMPDRFEYEYDY